MESALLTTASLTEDCTEALRELHEANTLGTHTAGELLSTNDEHEGLTDELLARFMREINGKDRCYVCARSCEEVHLNSNGVCSEGDQNGCDA